MQNVIFDGISIVINVFSYMGNKVNFVHMYSYQAMCSLSLIFGWTASLWQVAQDCADKLPFLSSDSEVMVTIIFVLMNNFISTLTELPLSFYDIFVIESHHGFNKQSVEMFMTDQLNYFIMIQIFFLPLSALSVMIVKVGGERFKIFCH